jgi:uncharacterized protein
MQLPAALQKPVDSMLPTTTGRIAALDVMRGVAILGILLANIVAYGTSDSMNLFDFETPPGGSEAWVSAFYAAFISGKFRSMLAILFGVGMYLQWRKMRLVEGAWPKKYFRRMGFLLLFGLVHAIFIFFGDILFLYSLVAMLACLFADLAREIIRKICIVLLGIWLAVGLCIAPAAIGFSFWIASKGSVDGMDFEMLGGITEAYATGTYLQVIQANLAMFAIMLASFVPFLPFMAGLFLLGFLLASNGVLAEPSKHKSTLRKMLIVGFAIGLPLNAVGFLLVNTPAVFAYQVAVDFSFSILLGIGYLAVIAIWVERGWFKALQNVLAKVGRVAFTCYIMQSVLAMFIFQGWALGLYDQLDQVGLFAVVLFIWTINILFAVLWLKHFSMGPIEWAWRCLSLGKRLPIRNQPA